MKIYIKPYRLNFKLVHPQNILILEKVLSSYSLEDLRYLHFRANRNSKFINKLAYMHNVTFDTYVRYLKLEIQNKDLNNL